MTTTTVQQQEAAVPLADGLFLLAYDELNGKPRLAVSILNLGLAGALLGELALTEKISLRHDSLVVTDPEPPQDALAAAVHLRLLRSVAPRPVRDWLLYFADDALNQVAERLTKTRQLAAHPSRLGRAVRYELGVALVE